MRPLLERKVGLWFALKALVSVVVGLAMYGSATQAIEAGRQAHQSYRLVRGLARIRVMLENFVASGRGYLLTHDPAHRKVYEHEHRRLSGTLDALGKPTWDHPRLRAQLEAAKPLVRERLAAVDELLARQQRQPLSREELDAAMERGRRLMERTEAALHGIEADEDLRLAQRMGQSDDGFSASLAVLATGLFINLAVLLNVFLFLGRELAKRRRAESSLVRRTQQAKLEADIGAILSRGIALRPALQDCAEAIVRRLDAAFVRIWTLNPEQDVLELQASAGLYTSITGSRSRIPIGSTKVGQIALQGVPQGTDDVFGDTRIADPAWARQQGLVSFAGCPLRVEGRTVGVLAAFARQPFADRALHAFDAISEGIAQCIARKRAEDALHRAHDELETRVRERTEELNQTREAAEAANRAKSQFLANVSHEIRTPINGILGMTELAHESSSNPEQRQYLELIKTSADALLAIINDILDFSKIEAGKLGLDPIDLNLHDLVDSALKPLAQRAYARGLELACRIAPDVPDSLVGDPVRLRQVLVNLVGNAIKFTEEGEVVVSISTDARTETEVDIHVAVSDTGVGVRPEQKAAIFEAFTQGDGSTTRKYGGTGLGLAIASTLVKLMSGRIWVEDNTEPGSVFHFTARLGIPAGDASASDDVDTSALAGLPILVVDDHRAARTILTETLSHWGARPLAVESGAAAQVVLEEAAARGRPFPLVLLDSLMPEMDGLELAGRIKADPQLADARIILLTSGSSIAGLKGRQRPDIAACLMKPIHPRQLRETILASLSLPAATCESHPALPRRTRTQDDVSMPRLRLLVAEDHAVNQILAVRLLERAGHEAVVVPHGRAVLETLATARFDAVLMDLQMPELDGFETLASIRRHEAEQGGRLPIIALTAHALRGDRERCLAAGFDDYLAKPIHVPELLAALERIMQYRDARPAPVVSSDDSETVFNREMALARLAGDDLLLRDVLGIFLDDAPRLLGEIRECVDRSDAPGLKHAAHTLKGVAANFAAPWAIQSMQALETLARSGDLSRAPALLPEVETSVSRLIVEVEQELNIRDSGPTRLDPLGEPVTALLPRMADAAESLAV